jgi:hypothetical protein
VPGFNVLSKFTGKAEENHEIPPSVYRYASPDGGMVVWMREETVESGDKLSAVFPQLIAHSSLAPRFAVQVSLCLQLML